MKKKKELTPAQQEAINEYNEKRVSTSARLLKKMIADGVDIEKVKDLIDPNESVTISFMLTSSAAYDVFHVNYVGHEESLGRNLMYALDKEDFDKLVDYQWYIAENNSGVNLIHSILDYGYFSTAEKILTDCFDKLSEDPKGFSWNDHRICEYFEHLTQRVNIFQNVGSIEPLYDLALNIGEKNDKHRKSMIVGDMGNGVEVLSENAKLNAIGTSIYDFLKLSITYNDIGLFKRLLSKIDKEDLEVIFYKSEKNIIENPKINEKYSKYQSVRGDSDFCDNLIKHAVDFKAVDFLRYMDEQLPIDKGFTIYEGGKRFKVNNFKDILISNLCGNAYSYFMYGNSHSIGNDREKLLEELSEAIKFSNEFKGVKQTTKFLRDNEGFNLFMDMGSKRFLNGLMKLLPELKKKDVLLNGHLLNIKEIILSYHFMNDFCNKDVKIKSKIDDKFETIKKNVFLLNDLDSYLRDSDVSLDKSIMFFKDMLLDKLGSDAIKELDNYVSEIYQYMLDKDLNQADKKSKMKI